MSTYTCSLLVVDDEPYILTTLAALLANDYEVLTAESAPAAQALFARRRFDLILADQKMPRMSGVQLLEWVRTHSPRTVRMLMTGYSDFDDTVEAINRAQVFRFITKPWPTTEALLRFLDDARRAFLLERQNEQLLAELDRRNVELRELNADLERRVAEATRELKEANRELETKNQMLAKLAYIDPLTGLFNRRTMDRLVDREILRHQRYPKPLALGLIDADNFKQINSRYLLPGGDQVLIELGKTLTASLRTVDQVGRIGGEEFLVVAPETSLEGAGTLGERIRSAVENHRFVYNNETIRVTVSIGFAVVDAHVQATYEQLKHVAAEALAQAKATGRNRCVLQAVNSSPLGGVNLPQPRGQPPEADGDGTRTAPAETLPEAQLMEEILRAARS